MNKQEWLKSSDPRRMLEGLSADINDRQLRLFAIACCRRVWKFLDEKNGHRGIEIAEDCADGLMTVRQSFKLQEELDFVYDYDLHEDIAKEKSIPLESISSAMFAVMLIMGFLDNNQAANVSNWVANSIAIEALGDCVRKIEYDETELFEKVAAPYKIQEKSIHASFLRDIVPNLAREVIFEPQWRTLRCMELAHEIYRNRDFNLLSKLGNFLREDGCNDQSILEHCYSVGPHVRGCWVIEAILQKG